MLAAQARRPKFIHPASSLVRSILQPWEKGTETESPKALLASQPNQNSEFQVIKGPRLKKFGNNKGRWPMLLSSLHIHMHMHINTYVHKTHIHMHMHINTNVHKTHIHTKTAF